MKNSISVIIAIFLSAVPAVLFAQEEAPPFEWENIGPDNMGGRTRALAFTPSGDRLYAGAAGGGLWVSENTGLTWRKVESFSQIEEDDDGQASLSVSSIAIDPANPNVIYVGTGEIALNFNKPNFSNYGFNSYNGSGFGFLGYSGIPGKGVFVSTDGGQTWTNNNATWTTAIRRDKYAVMDPETGEILNPWLSVQKVAVNNGRAFAGTMRGLFYTDDNFATIATPQENYADTLEESELLRNAIVLDVETTPDGAVYVATEDRVFVSRDNGTSFTQILQGLDFPRLQGEELRSGLTRMEVAVSESNPNILYIAELTNQALNGIWRSEDAGATWSRVAPPSSVFQSASNLSFAPTQYQGGSIGRYTFTLHVDRNDPDHIYMGSVQWWEYTPDRGWRNTTTNVELFPWNQNYVPRNQHIVVNHPTQSETILIGTDRQICSSRDGGETYKVATGLYSASSAYSVDVTLSGQIVASTANAGVVLKENTSARSFRIIQDGSEGIIRASHFNPEHFLSSSSQYQIERSLNDGEDFTDFVTDNRGEIIGTPGEGLNPDSCAREKLSPYPDVESALSELSAGPQNYPITQFVLDPYSENEGDNVLRNRDNEQVKRGYAYHAYDNAVFVSYNPFGETEGERFMLPVTPTGFYDNAGSPPNRVSALAVSGDADHVLYIGTTNGKLFRVFNAHDPCSENFQFEEINTSDMPQRWITSITFMPGRADTMLVTYGGYDDDYSIGDNIWASNIFASFNAKADDVQFHNQHSFTLPDFPIYTAFFNPQNPEEWLLLGTEEGVWYMNPTDFTEDEEQASLIDYFPANDGEMFTVPVYDFAYHEWGYATDSVVYIKSAPNGNRIPVEDSSFVLRVRAKSSFRDEETVGMIGDTTIIYEHNIMLPPAVAQNIGNIYIATFGLGIFRSEVANFNNKVTSRPPAIDESQFITIYPNPAADKAKIRLEEPLDGSARARLFSLDGREIKSWEIDATGLKYAELDLEGVAAGAYFLKFSAEQNGRNVESVGKLVITRR